MPDDKVEHDIEIEKLKRRELVLGLVAPIGADLRTFINNLKQCLSDFDYDAHEIKVTDALNAEYPAELKDKDPNSIETVELKIELGNKVRADRKQPDFLMKYAASNIRELRSEREKHKAESKPIKRGVAFIISQLKRPEEIRILRMAYGDTFFLIGVQAPEEARISHLMARYHCKDRARAVSIVEMDRDEAAYRKSQVAPATTKLPQDFDYKKFGQQTADVFHQSDFFVKDTSSSSTVFRFLDLLFGSPSVSPTRSEHCMFLAFSMAARSADLGRQVGAVIASKDGDLIAVGTNDTPCFGGGQYQPSESDQRDHARGFESNSRQIDHLCDSISSSVLALLEKKDPETKQKVKKHLRKETELKSLTEFMRSVHAEAEAILQCARMSVSPVGGVLYSTTFPCHNCAKHIVGAGLREVYYVEPYAKSLAAQLHVDAVKLVDDDTKTENKVAFRPFIGIGARQFLDLFSVSLSFGDPIEKKDENGVLVVPYARSKNPLRFYSLASATDAVEGVCAEAVKQKQTPEAAK